MMGNALKVAVCAIVLLFGAMALPKNVIDQTALSYSDTNPSRGWLSARKLSQRDINPFHPTITFDNPANPAADTGGGPTVNFAGTSLGSNGTNRVVVVTAMFTTNQAAATISSISLGSGSASSVVTKYQSDGGSPADWTGCAIWSFTGVSATSATVAVNLSTSLNAGRGLAISVVNLLGANPTAFATASAGAASGTTPLAVSVNTVNNGAVIAAAATSKNTGSVTWANATKLGSDRAGAVYTLSAAGNATAAGSSPLAVTATANATANQCGVAASFQPI
jgi:hypothetical protein